MEDIFKKQEEIKNNIAKNFSKSSDVVVKAESDTIEKAKVEKHYNSNDNYKEIAKTKSGKSIHGGSPEYCDSYSCDDHKDAAKELHELADSKLKEADSEKNDAYYGSKVSDAMSTKAKAMMHERMASKKKSEGK